jgi:hypothetical protein
VLKFGDNRHTTLDTAPPDEGLARHRNLYLSTHNTQKRLISVLLVEFEPAIPASERPQTHALDRAANGTGIHIFIWRVRKIAKNDY